MKYKEMRLGDVAEINMGQSPNSKYFNSDGKGIEFLQGIRTFGENYPFFDTYTTQYNKISEKGDILFSVRAPVGKINWSDRKIAIGRGLAALKVLPNFSSKYVYYFLKKIGSQINSISSGTVFSSINKKELANVKILIPDSLKDQEYIGTRLALLDKKIELNNRINDNLLELAQTIFQEILKISSLHALTISDVGTVVGGGTPSKRIVKYWNGDIPWLSPKDLSNHPRVFTSHGENNITQDGLDNSSTKLLPQNTILFSSRAPIGYLSIANNQIATNQGFKSIIPNKEYPFWFIYELLKSETPKIINEANGSTFKEISGGRLKQHAIDIPSSADVLEYNSVFLPLFDKIRQSEKEINSLNQIKNALLNRLF